MTYRVTYTQTRPHPGGGTYTVGPYVQTVQASDASIVRDYIRTVHPGAKIARVVDLDAAYDARARRAERARNR